MSGEACAPARPAFGDVLETVQLGDVRLTRRYGCTYRDQYEINAPAPLSPSLRERLAARGALRGSPALYVLDVPHEFQLTVAPAAGRAVLMPRMESPRDRQRAAAFEIAGLIAETTPLGSIQR